MILYKADFVRVDHVGVDLMRIDLVCTHLLETLRDLQYLSVMLEERFGILNPMAFPSLTKIAGIFILFTLRNDIDMR